VTEYQLVAVPNQRQGRALHPVGSERMGLWLRLPELQRAHCCVGPLESPLQLAPWSWSWSWSWSWPDFV